MNTCLAAEAMLVDITISVWLITPGKESAGTIFTSDHMVYLIEPEGMRGLESIQDTYLGHDNNFVAR